MNKKAPVIPGNTSTLAPWGDAVSFFKNYHEHKRKKLEKYGKIYKMKFLKNEINVFLNKESANFILVEHNKDFNSKEAWDLILKDLFPNGLMLMDGEKHRHHRAVISEVFKKEPMQGYLDMMKTIVPNTLKQWNNPNPKLYFLLKSFTLEIALEVFFGIEKDQRFSKINTAISNIVEASSAVPVKLPFTKFSKGIKARKYLLKFFGELLPERKKNPKNDLFSLLATAKTPEGASLSDQEILDHLIFMLMASHDTTASTLTSFCYFLAKHPEWQERLRKESREFYETQSSDFSVKDLRQLEALNLALKETLRRFPPLVTVGRVSNTDLEFEGFDIPAGTHVSTDFDQNHHNPEIWSCPMQFDPERFSKERNEQNKCPFTYTPFGAGSHHCIGFSFAEMQIKYIMSQLLITHKWSVPKNYEIPIKPVPIQKPMDGLPVFIEKIKSPV